jgi:DNA modification methylase
MAASKLSGAPAGRTPVARTCCQGAASPAHGVGILTPGAGTRPDSGVGLRDASMLIFGDCLEKLPGLDADSIDSCVTDPPYHLGFMGKQWDGGDIAFRPEVWREVYRVLKPGAHLLAFGGTRTYHRMACAIEDAGFEIRDCVMWLYGSGFPKSHDVSKGIDEHIFNEWLDAHPIEREKYHEQMRQAGDSSEARAHVKNKFRKAAGAEREVVGFTNPSDPRQSAKGVWGQDGTHRLEPLAITRSATEAAKAWEGWGTALKPAVEPIVFARKPLSEKTVAANVLRWGTGAINVDGCRVEAKDQDDLTAARQAFAKSDIHTKSNIGGRFLNSKNIIPNMTPGRWPANVIHDGSDEVVGAFPAQAGGGDNREKGSGKRLGGFGNVGHAKGDSEPNSVLYSDCGSAARFFYSPKADGLERNKSAHPTIKPLDLMRYLVRLVTPRGGTVLDPFAGSGTTGEAALNEGMKCVLIEREAEYRDDIERRLSSAQLGFSL